MNHTIVWCAALFIGTCTVARSAPPLSFEKNQGQADAGTRYLARTSTHTALIGTDGLSLAGRGGAISVRFVGASPNARVVAENPLEGISNYYLGAREITGVPHYGRVRVNNVRDGIDVVYYGNDREMEYDLVIHPGADPGAIRLRFDGAQRPSLDANGDLVLKTAWGELRQRRPRVWQGRDQVECRYAVTRSGDVRLLLGAYRRAAELVVDPVLSFSTYYGDTGAAVAIDGSGNVYVTGATYAFPVTSGPNPGENILVSKLNPLGTAVIYSTYIVSGGRAGAIAADSAGNAYITGTTSNAKAFVTKLGPTGTVVYSTVLGDDLSGYYGIAVDATGAAYVTGATSSRDFPVTATGLPSGPTAFLYHVFAAKLTPSGQIGYAVTFGGSGYDYGSSIAVDAAGNAYITGTSTSPDFPTTAGAYSTSLKGGFDAFVAVLNPTASKFVYSTYLGGSDMDEGSAIAVDTAGNAYVTGDTLSVDFPVVGGFVKSRPTSFDNQAGYIAKLNPAGTALVYSSYLPGSFRELPSAVAVDANGSAYVTGSTLSSDFPTTPGALKAAPPPQYPYNVGFIFLMQIKPDGSGTTYSTLLGGSGSTYANNAGTMALDSKGGVYIGGSTSSSTLPVTPGAVQASKSDPNQLWAGLVAKIDMSSPTLCNASLSQPQTNLPGRGGTFSYTLTLPPGCPWEAISDPFISVNPPRGMGSPGPIQLSATVAPNDSTSSARTGGVLTGNATFTVNQSAGSCQDAILSPPSVTLPSFGMSGNISVTLPSSCAWTAMAADTWLSVVTSGAGTGPGTIGISAGANPLPTQRTTTVTVAGKSVSITQLAGAGCGLGASGPNASFSAQGGTGVVRVTTDFIACAWTAASGSSWIQVTGTGSGQGSGSVPFIVTANPGTSVRSGTITIGDQTVAIVQYAGTGTGSVASYKSILFAGGNPLGTPLGDYGAATSAGLISPRGLAFDTVAQTLYIADSFRGRVRAVTPDGMITTVAGGGTSTDENVAATSAYLFAPAAVAVDGLRGSIYVTDSTRVRRITQGVINTVAGSYVAGSSGDNGEAASALLSNPTGLAVNLAGDLFISDTANNRIREVSGGTIANFAGGGTGPLGDNGPAVDATLSYPGGIATDAVHLFVADQNDGRIRSIAQGIINTVAGGGSGGDGGLATAAALNDPMAVALDPAGNLFIADGYNHAVRKVATDGAISTISPSGIYYSVPAGIAADAAGNVYVSDAAANAVYVLTPVAPVCTYSVSTPGVQPVAGGTLTLTVTTAAGCNWSGSSDLTWAAITSGASGTGTGTVSLNISPAIVSFRVGSFTVAGQTVPIKQSNEHNTRDIRGIGVSDAVIYDPTNGQEYTALSNGSGGFSYVPNLFTPGFDTLRFGDFDGDGKADLVLYNSTTSLAYIGLGDGTGHFAFQSLFWSPGYDQVVAGDLNGDGKTDFVLYRSTDGTLYTALSNGDGTFTYKYTLVSSGYNVTVADFNGDGKADVFLYRIGDGLANLGLSDGNGGFAFIPVIASSGYSAVQAGDLNGDGTADLVLYNGGNGNAAVGLSGGPSFTFTPQIFSPGFTSVRLLDFNGDGKADAALYNSHTAVGYLGVGDGTGAFTFGSLFWGAGVDTVDVLDLNGDGKADVILYNSQNAATYSGISTGNAANPFTYQYSYWGTNRVFAR